MSVPLKNRIKVGTGALPRVVSSHRGGDAALFNGKYLCYEDARTPGDQMITCKTEFFLRINKNFSRKSYYKLSMLVM